jgi:pantoate--beta-alanine ligase
VKRVSSPQALQKLVEAQRRAGRRVGLVPTMGALHEGHASLVRRARRECDVVLASIFVNPAQFGPKEDFSRYPRTLRHDLALLRREGCDLVFAPSVHDMYPAGFDTTVVPGALARELEGAHRPGHFKGVATVCLKLFTVCKPHRAYFGAKDYQQALVVRKMAHDFNLDLTLVLCPTVRDRDGLALSSRNRYLSAAERRTALALPRALAEQARLLQAGGTTAGRAQARGLSALARVPGLVPDYFVVRAAETLRPCRPGDRQLVLLAAARVGKTRLIDNIRVTLKSRR